MRNKDHEGVRPAKVQTSARGLRPAVANALAATLLIIMAALMFGPAWQDSATVDETTFLGGGYSYWTGHRYYFVPEHPPLSQMLPSFPLLFMNVKLSDTASALLEKRTGYPWTIPWSGSPRAVQELFPDGQRDNWYFMPNPEGQLFGQMLVYGSGNDGNAMMFAGRLVQVGLTLLTGLLIYIWGRQAGRDPLAGLLGLAMWVFQPSVLAHGHLITTDIGATLGMAAAVYCFLQFVQKPSSRWAALCGAATGLSLVMKHTAVILAPTYIVLAAFSWKNLVGKVSRPVRTLAVFVGAIWLVILAVYFPRWSPPPPLGDAQASVLGVPGWFQAFRPLLLPGYYFKSLAIGLGHAKEGHLSYLFGAWSQHGWWYFYPAVFFLKSPLAFVILAIIAACVAAQRWKTVSPLAKYPWIAAVVYIGLAMTSNVNIGVRHMLPFYALVCVGAGAAWPLVSSRFRWVIIGLLAWQAVVTVIAYPLYLQFISEAAGGAQNGYRCLYDSNYDWGQDANRLKRFLDEQGIPHIYLDYFGTQFNIDYLKIKNTRTRM